MSNNTAKYINEISDEESDILEISVLNSKSELCSVFAFDDTIRLKVRFKVSQEKLNHNPIIGLKIIDQQERSVFTTQKYLSELNIDNNQNNSVIIELPNSFLVPSNYSINLGFHIKNREQITALKKIVSFTVEETGTDFSSYSSKDYGCVIVDCNWSKNS